MPTEENSLLRGLPDCLTGAFLPNVTGKPCFTKMVTPHGNCELTAESSGKRALVRILVVDDNPAVRHYLRAILEQQETWQVCDEARTGAEALARIQKTPPDVILLDFQMPDRNGLDVARAIIESWPGIPILMVTVHMSRQLADAARAVGIRGACAKSDVGSIVQAVQALLQKETYFPPMIPKKYIKAREEAYKKPL